jgi:hypothetical protein
MKTFSEWKNKKQYFELTATPAVQTPVAAAPAAMQTPAPAATPTPAVDANPETNPMEDLSQVVAQRMDYLFDKLENLSYQKIIETQQAFALRIQQLLASKSVSNAKRGARSNVQFARQMANPMAKPMG